jgi:hypothetical protein
MDSTQKIIKNGFRVHKLTKSQKSTQADWATNSSGSGNGLNVYLSPWKAKTKLVKGEEKIVRLVGTGLLHPTYVISD